MALTLKVPTIFTAKDKVSSIVRTMGRNVQGFTNKLQTGVSAGNRLFRKLTPSIGEAGKQLLSFASAASIATGIFATANFSSQKMMDYEDAVASFRTIVSDLNDVEFAKFESAIGKVAKDTKKSTVDIANSFEMIAGLNSDFAKTAGGLSQVSEAAITLSKASKDELGVATENLIGIMNQFNYGAEESARVINVLAAGQAVGAASISQSAKSYKNFGAVAAGANVTLEESMALIQTLAGKMITGSEAGTGLKAVILKLQQAGLGYSKGQFDINEALEQAKAKFDKLKTAKEKDAYLTDLIGANHINTGAILLNNLGTYKDFTAGVTGTSEAQKAAAINTDTFRVKIEQLKNKWVNLITTNKESNSTMETAKDMVGWVTDNMEDLIKWVVIGVSVFAGFKAILIATEVALGIYNVALGISGALSGVASVAIGKSAIALKAYQITVGIATAAQWLWNAAMTANPIGIIIVAIGVLIALITAIIVKWDEWGAAVSMFLGPLGLVISVVQSFRRNWEMVKKAFQTGGIIGGLKAIGRVLLDAILQPVQQLLGLLAKLPGMSGLAGLGAQKINEMRQKLGVEGVEPLDSPAVKQQKITNESIKTTKNNVDINVNDPNNKVSVKKRGDKSPVKVTKTNGVR